MLVAGVVGFHVVPVAQRDAVSDVGVAAVGPAGLVVGVESVGAVAAFCAAAAVAGEHRVALVAGVESSSAADVEGLGVAAEDDGDDLGLAGEPAGQGGADLLAGVEDPGLLDPAHQ